MRNCTHDITQIRAKLRRDDGTPTMVGHQCVDCHAAVQKRVGQYWIPKSEWPEDIPDWEPETSMKQQSLLPFMTEK